MLEAFIAERLASAYELRSTEVDDDARVVAAWTGSNEDLRRLLDEMYRWTADSECALYYVRALRNALRGENRDKRTN